MDVLPPPRSTRQDQWQDAPEGECGRESSAPVGSVVANIHLRKLRRDHCAGLAEFRQHCDGEIDHARPGWLPESSLWQHPLRRLTPTLLFRPNAIMVETMRALSTRPISGVHRCLKTDRRVNACCTGGCRQFPQSRRDCGRAATRNRSACLPRSRPEPAGTFTAIVTRSDRRVPEHDSHVAVALLRAERSGSASAALWRLVTTHQASDRPAPARPARAISSLNLVRRWRR
jgi:hypothetical protein